MKNPMDVAMCHKPVGFSTCFLPEWDLSVAFGYFLNAGESHPIPFTDVFLVYPMYTDAGFHASHGDEQSFQPFVSQRVVGREEDFLSAQASDEEHGADVAFGVVVVFRRCPPADDGAHGKGFPFLAEALPVGLQQFAGSPIAVGHAPELHEAGVGLLYRHALPSTGGVADVERIVVSDASGCVRHIYIRLDAHARSHPEGGGDGGEYGDDDVEYLAPGVLVFHL